jgi:hypothetical protein
MYVARSEEANESLLGRGEGNKHEERRNRARTKPTFTATCLSWRVAVAMVARMDRIDSWQTTAGCSRRDWQEAGTASLLRAKPGTANDGACGGGKEAAAAEQCVSVAGAGAWACGQESGCAAVSQECEGI